MSVDTLTETVSNITIGSANIKSKATGSSEKSIPIIDLGKAKDPSTKPEFLKELKHALFNVGFFYISKPLPGSKAFDTIKQQSLNFFEIPLEEKLKIDMTNSKHFLGYSPVGDEVTAFNVDWREQVEFATELPEPVINNDDELYKNIEGPNLWPSEKYLPNFKQDVTEYINELSKLSRFLLGLIEEALGLKKGELESFFKTVQQAKLKIIKYPDLESIQEKVSQVENELKTTNVNSEKNQGVGEHRDNDFFTLIFQASNHTSLQVKDFNGDWINVPPIQDTLVFAVGLTLEFLTQKAAIATVHRVLTPKQGEGDRLSISFFQTINIESKKVSLDISKETLELVKTRDLTRIPNKIGFQFQVDDEKPVGYSVFLNRIKSHPKVGAKFYPKVLEFINEELKKSQKV